MTWTLQRHAWLEQFAERIAVPEAVRDSALTMYRRRLDKEPTWYVARPWQGALAHACALFETVLYVREGHLKVVRLPAVIEAPATEEAWERLMRFVDAAPEATAETNHDVLQQPERNFDDALWVLHPCLGLCRRRVRDWVRRDVHALEQHVRDTIKPLSLSWNPPGQPFHVHTQLRAKQALQRATGHLKALRQQLNPDWLRPLWGLRIPDVRVYQWVAQGATPTAQARRIEAIQRQGLIMPLALLGNGTQGGLLPRAMPADMRLEQAEAVKRTVLTALERAIEADDTEEVHAALEAALHIKAPNEENEYFRAGGGEVWKREAIRWMQGRSTRQTEAYPYRLGDGAALRVQAARHLPPHRWPRTEQEWRVMGRVAKLWRNQCPAQSWAQWPHVLKGAPDSWSDPFWYRLERVLGDLGRLEQNLGHAQKLHHAEYPWLAHWTLARLLQWLEASCVRRSLVGQGAWGKRDARSQQAWDLLTTFAPALAAQWKAHPPSLNCT